MKVQKVVDTETFLIFQQIICPSPKVWDFDKKKLHWVFVVRGVEYGKLELLF